MTDRITTVEELVRGQLSKALGGPRGIAESALPTAAFTILFLTTDNLKLSLIVSGAAAAVLLLIRIIQRSPTQFVFNAGVGIAIAAVFALRSGQAKDVFLPGIIYNGVYASVLIVSIAVGWPIVGFIVGSVTGEPTEWHRDRPMVKLCSRLTWLLALPCIVRVAVQLPLYSADKIGWLGTSKIALGWPLQVAALSAMVWLLARNNTPLEEPRPHSAG
ncbi:hypothetical protein BH09ACT10_BH09ACT10_01740 [soil metagenome]